MITWGLVSRLIALLTTLLVAPIAGGSGTPLSAAASSAPAAYTYDASAYVYDAPAQLSSPDIAASYVRGSPSGPDVASWGRSVSTRGCCTAANTADRTVAMGRNMTDRVIPYATKNGRGWYHGTPGWVPRSAIGRISPRALERIDLWFNQRWIRGEMRGGSRIVDIGEPPGYPPSAFYDMERQQVSGY